jgi:hypothetical protein
MFSVITTQIIIGDTDYKFEDGSKIQVPCPEAIVVL